MKDKFILDACCGQRMFWWDKQHPNTLYIDNRVRIKGFINNRENRLIAPDILMDFRDLKFPDKSFKLVVFDPPHLKNMSKTFLEGDEEIKKSQFRMGDTYGYLNKETWKEDLKKGFDECWRVLDDYGVLIFKWGDHDISVKRILEVLGKDPLFGHRTRVGKKASYSTHWFCFMKIPIQEMKEEER